MPRPLSSGRALATWGATFDDLARVNSYIAHLDQQKLAAEQQPGANARPETAVAEREALPSPAHDADDQQRGNQRAQPVLQYRMQERGGGLDRHLLHAPAGAQQNHQADGRAIQRFADRGHETV